MKTLSGNYYTEDEYKDLAKLIDGIAGTGTRFSILWKRHGYQGSYIKSYFNDLTTSFQYLHTNFFDIYILLYGTCYEDLPLVMGDSFLLNSIIRWRLEIKK